jgi:hypothetical protein
MTKRSNAWLLIRVTDTFLSFRFRWAYCQLQALKKLKSTAPKYVTHALNTLPATLDETYTRVLLDIEDVYHEHAFILLRWLAYARSPPTLGELVEAAVTNPIYDSSIDEDNRGDLEDTLNILSGLVTVEGRQDAGVESYSEAQSCIPNVSNMDRNEADVALHDRRLTPNTKVRPAHFSVKEYLESKRIVNTDARHFYLESGSRHMALVQSCLTYLRYYSTSSGKMSTTQDLDTFPLLRYAAESWFYHSALQNCVEDSREVSFLQLETVRNDWLLVHTPDEAWKKPFEGKRKMKWDSSTYYASLLGLPVVVGSLLGGGADVNVQGGVYGNALQAASGGGHREIVQLLLDKGADVNAQGGVYSNALQAALVRGHREIVQLLQLFGAFGISANGKNGTDIESLGFVHPIVTE